MVIRGEALSEQIQWLQSLCSSNLVTAPGRDVLTRTVRLLVGGLTLLAIQE